MQWNLLHRTEPHSFCLTPFRPYALYNKATTVFLLIDLAIEIQLDHAYGVKNKSTGTKITGHVHNISPMQFCTIIPKNTQPESFM